MTQHIFHQASLFRSRCVWRPTKQLPLLLVGLCVLLKLPLAIASGNQNAEWQSADSLRQTALSFLQTQTANSSEQDIEISLGLIDSRLSLSRCANTPKAFLAAGAKLQGKLTVGLRCTAPKPWTVYIPAHIKVFAEVIAAAHPLLRGTTISASDIITVRQDLSLLRGGYFTNKTDVIKNVLKQNLGAGQAITPNRIKRPILVHRGEKVTILASMGNLQVRGKGEALKDAALGERVSVRNTRSKRIVQGIATKPGTVSVRM